MAAILDQIVGKSPQAEKHCPAWTSFPVYAGKYPALPEKNAIVMAENGKSQSGKNREKPAFATPFLAT
jgi:hypothetical protein